MTPERYQLVCKLYQEVLGVAPTQRRFFLSRTCDGDVALQREVESLFRYETDSPTIVDRSALELLGRAVAVEQTQSWVGRQIGHYRVSALLGGGGMDI